MTEQKVKKRGWIKNAAIIFLAAMLFLTFFSNTIMNHSLPEVAAQYVQSGTISAKIRGTGTVTANESYEVKSEQSREVLSVPVKVGDKVAVGDTLLYYSDAESTQLKEAQDALDALILAYKKALINTSDSDYAKQNRDIQLAQEALDKAKVERDKYIVSTADLGAAKANYNTAKTETAIQQAKVDALSEQLSGLTPGNDNTAAIMAKTNEVTIAQNAYDAAMLSNKEGYDKIKACAATWQMAIPNPADRKDIAVYMEALAQSFANLLKSTGTFPSTPPSEISKAFPTTGVTFDKDTVTQMSNAYTVINPLEKTLTTLKNELTALYNSSGGDYNYYMVKNQLAEARKTLTTLQTNLANYESFYKELEEKNTQYQTAQAAVETNQKNLQDLMFALAEQKKADGKTQASQALDLEAQRKQIEEKTEELEDLKAGGEGATIESKVNGVVAAVNISAGKTAEKDAVLMTIEVPDMGYGISFSVTTEQSKRVALGDTAEISNYYYYSESITATLVAIKSDPQNPMTNKILSFKLQGEVESGSQLSLSIGERGGNYETIVPTSAIRSDNNGKFVLAVIAKNSPLGNRYIAQRIDVKVLAADDVNSAVSGGLTTSDFVITTSTKPIEPGMQVRLAD